MRGACRLVEHPLRNAGSEACRNDAAGQDPPRVEAKAFHAPIIGLAAGDGPGELPHERDELLGVERLAEDGVGGWSVLATELRRARDEDDRQPRLARVALGDEVSAPLAAEVEIEDDDVDGVERPARLGERRRLGDLAPLQLEDDPAEEPNRRLVVEDEDARGRRMPSHGARVYWPLRKPVVTLACPGSLTDGGGQGLPAAQTRRARRLGTPATGGPPADAALPPQSLARIPAGPRSARPAEAVAD